MYAKILADSVSNDGDRLTTMEVQTWRFVLAEFNTHRWFSRNSASSRAIPVHKQLKRVRDSPAIPLEWPREQRGMQGGGPVEDPKQAETWWRNAAENAADTAEAMSDLGLHKSVTNRLLEPFMWHTIVVTATEWDNFFDQRCSPLAQPEIRVTAEGMRSAYTASVPDVVSEYGWHLPYISREDEDGALLKVPFGPHTHRDALEILKKVSAARCARVSYLTQDGKRDLDEDMALYERLISADPPHWSPLEHVATPWKPNVEQLIALDVYLRGYGEGKFGFPNRTRRPRVGNITGWRSLRTEAEMVAKQ